MSIPPARLGLRLVAQLARGAPAARSVSSLALQPAHPPHSSRHDQRQNQRASTSNVLFYASSAATVLAVTSPLLTVRSDFSTLSSSPSTTTTTTSDTSSKAPEITLFQFEVCPFCNKVRAYLDFHGVPYRVVEVDPLRKTELKRFSSDYRKVPIALVNDRQINGSAAVISEVDALIHPTSTPSTTSETELKWLDWLDNTLIHLVAPNIYRTWGESLQTFNYITDHSKFSAWDRFSIRYSGAALMLAIGRRLKKKYGIESERDEMHAEIAKWTDAVAGGFLDGKKEPGVAELSVYGVLRALRTFDTFAEIRSKNDRFAQWFDMMADLVGESSRTATE